MTRAQSPASSQRRLLAAVREARETLKLTQKEVAEALDWSVSKLIRIENGSVGLSTTDLKALLLQYGITDRDRVESYVQLSKAGKQPAWWDEYRRYFRSEFVKFLGLESSAVLVRQFQLLLVPGLLQVPAYSRSVMTKFTTDAEQVERGLAARATRQRRLDDPELQHFFVIDESVLYRRITDIDGWRAQLLHLKAVSGQVNATIQILPFKAGFMPGMRSSFQVLELSDELDDLFLTVEQPDGDVYYDDVAGADKAAEFVKIFFQLEEAALPPEETPRVIDKALAGLEEE
ncbi:helix-turn-helix domain-containing protein [Amycolatopsis azurea]|uniref:Transcriptional regulator n=1 Tax=Amycolatopsis azurea DSM 43854 TaxID=1238180 RepID=A0ABX3JM18_9PSEU|nr:helix-turn-helix transcriptional regulator [Amycolatopsis azurea]OOC07701.1 transcriptional regulator [Amycolatopsis azurea DSM 43854]